MVKKICSFYQYLFYKYTTWSVWLNCGLNPFPYHGGWGFLSVLLGTNAMTIIIIIQIITGYGIRETMNLPGPAFVIFASSFFIFNYFIFLKNRKYKKIIKKYENEDRVTKTRGNILAWASIILTFGLFFSSSYVLSKVRPLHNRTGYAADFNNNQHDSNAYKSTYALSNKPINFENQ